MPFPFPCCFLFPIGVASVYGFSASLSICDGLESNDKEMGLGKRDSLSLGFQDAKSTVSVASLQLRVSLYSNN